MLYCQAQYQLSFSEGIRQFSSTRSHEGDNINDGKANKEGGCIGKDSRKQSIRCENSDKLKQKRLKKIKA